MISLDITKIGLIWYYATHNTIYLEVVGGEFFSFLFRLATGKDFSRKKKNKYLFFLDIRLKRRTNGAPANEHLTMQIAAQVFKLPAAKNALIFFNDGMPAYITKRFDVKEDGSRCLKEDFASLAKLTAKSGKIINTTTAMKPWRSSSINIFQAPSGQKRSFFSWLFSII